VDSPQTRSDSLAVPAARGILAVVCSVLASVCLVLLAPALYLAVDLLATQGRVAVTSDTIGVVNRQVSEAAAEHFANTSPCGVLATVVRNRDHWSAGVLGAFARTSPWAWTNEGLLTGLFLAAVILLALRGLFMNAAAHTASGGAVAAAQKLRRDVYNHSFRLGGLATHPDQQADAGVVITDRVEAMQDGWVASRTTFVRTLTMLVLTLPLLLASHLWLGLAVLCLGGLVWLVAGQSAAWFRRDARLAERRATAQMGVMRESLRLMLLVKCFLMERFNQTRLERQLNDLSKSALRQYRGEVLSKPTLYTVAALTGLVLLYLAGRVVLGGGASLAGIAVLAAAAVGLAVAAVRFVGAAVKGRKARAAAADVGEFLDRRTDAAQAIDAEFLQPLTKKLDLIEVSYREPGTGRMVLEGVTMSIPVGSKAAVLYSDPDEARSLAYLLTRFLEPSAGEVRFDGKNTRWVTFESLRTQVAMVLPDHTTFTDTVANNIGCGDTFTLPQIVDAAKKAHAHGFVQRLPYGYETVIGDAATSLRPGERFRLALARAVLRDPTLLVIEEPAEPFDADSTALIDDAVNRLAGSHTILILARRSHTVKTADRVFVIQDGKLVASGDHDSLLSGSQVYKAIHSRRTQTEAGSM
jgi:ABC-type multidrug transport system fused ATPase/permease subunit